MRVCVCARMHVSVGVSMGVRMGVLIGVHKRTYSCLCICMCVFLSLSLSLSLSLCVRGSDHLRILSIHKLKKGGKNKQKDLALESKLRYQVWGYPLEWQLAGDDVKQLCVSVCLV